MFNIYKNDIIILILKNNKHSMKKTSNDFISNDNKKFKWQCGTLLASSLSGFIAGIIVSALFFLTLFDMTFKGSNLGF